MLTRRGGTHELTLGRNLGIGGAPSSPPSYEGAAAVAGLARPHLQEAAGPSSGLVAFFARVCVSSWLGRSL